MQTIHFTSSNMNADGDTIYHLTINSQPYIYNKDTDYLENQNTGELEARLDMPADLIKAFHQAWDPERYAAALETTPTLYGIPDDTEDPTSPLYYPQKPAGQPVELRKQLEKQAAAQDMATLLAAYYQTNGGTLDDMTARRLATTINTSTQED